MASRTAIRLISNGIVQIDFYNILDYADLKKLIDMDAVKAFRERALKPENPANGVSP